MERTRVELSEEKVRDLLFGAKNSDREGECLDQAYYRSVIKRIIAHRRQIPPERKASTSMDRIAKIMEGRRRP